MRVGVFGGSFDPVHLGHLWVAESAAETLELDLVRWIPAATSPLKPAGPVASGEARLQMLRLALSGSPLHLPDDRELRRGEVSFTVDTLESLREEAPDDELFLLIGSDSLASFGLWKSPERILSLASLAVIQRGGEAAMNWTVLDALPEGWSRCEAKQFAVTVPTIEVSSSSLRERIRAGKSIRYRTPRAVEAFLEAERLYRSSEIS